MTQYQLLTCTFIGAANQAQAAAQEIGSRFPDLKDNNVALVSHRQDGSLSIHETAEVREGSRASAAGTVAGWLLGFANALVGAPSGPLDGARLGHATAQEASVDYDSGFADPFLRELGQQLDRGETAVLVVVHHDQSAAVSSVLAALGGSPSTQDLTPELLARLRT